MSQFDKLMADLNGLQQESETLTKSLAPADGQQAGAGAGAEGGEGAAAAAGGEAGAAATGAAATAGAQDEVLGKALQLTDDKGNAVEAYDGTALVKSLIARMDGSDEQLQKAFTGMHTLVKAQGETIKALVDQVKKLSSEPRGRKAILAVHDKNGAGDDTLAKGGDSTGMTGEQFMLKAQTCFNKGLLTGVQLTTADVALRSGQPIPTEILSKVVTAAV